MDKKIEKILCNFLSVILLECENLEENPPNDLPGIIKRKDLDGIRKKTKLSNKNILKFYLGERFYDENGKYKKIYKKIK